jgi:taurine dioxygenase
LNITPFKAPLGAKVSGLDLSLTLEEHSFSDLYAAWLEHSVLVIPDQSLTEPALVEFSKRLGQLELPPASETRARGDGGASLPEIWTISNVKVDGVAIGGLGNSEADWHTDMSYLETPPIASVLYAREIPEVGANTSFADMYTALDSMPAGLRQRLSDISVQHDSAYTSVGTLRDGAAKVGDASEAVGAIHPAVRTHPETNRQALYMGRRLNASIQNMPMEQSEGLLDEIWSYCTQRRFVYEHVWKIGDLVMWDNRCTIHRRDAFDSEQRRIMWRTQVKAR